MFNIGFSELVIICIVLIVVVGPERLPSMMKTMGKTIRSLRQASRDLRASTGIDELLREDFDLYAPAPSRRPAPPPPPPDEAPVSRQEPVVVEDPAGPALLAGDVAALPPGEAPAPAPALIGGEASPFPTDAPALAAPAALQPPAAVAVVLPSAEVAPQPPAADAPQPPAASTRAQTSQPPAASTPAQPLQPPAAATTEQAPSPPPAAASSRRDSTLNGIAPPPELTSIPDPHGAGGGQGS